MSPPDGTSAPPPGDGPSATIWRMARMERDIEVLDRKMDALTEKIDGVLLRLVLIGLGFALTVAGSAIALLLTGSHA